jgi:hypothetical protein
VVSCDDGVPPKRETQKLQQSRPRGPIFEGCLSKKETTSIEKRKRKNDDGKECWEKTIKRTTGAALSRLGWVTSDEGKTQIKQINSVLGGAFMHGII